MWRCPTPFRWPEGRPGQVTSWTRRRRLLAAAASLSAWSACAPGSDPPGTALDGQQAYAIRCGYCHDVPNGIGTTLTPRVLAAYSTVGALDRYLRVAMPHEAPGSLPSAEYDAIVAYLIESRELVPGGVNLRELPDSARLRAP